MTENFLTILGQSVFAVLRSRRQEKRQYRSAALAGVVFYFVGVVFLLVSLYAWILSQGISSAMASLGIGVLSLALGTIAFLISHMMRKRSREHDLAVHLENIIQAFLKGLATSSSSQEYKRPASCEMEEDSKQYEEQKLKKAS